MGLLLLFAAEALASSAAGPANICELATMVVVGTVSKRDSVQSTDYRIGITTLVTFEIERRVIGTPPQPLVLRVHGGRAGEPPAEEHSADPRFPAGGRYLLVLSDAIGEGLPRLVAYHGAPFGDAGPPAEELRLAWTRMCAAGHAEPHVLAKWFPFLADAPKDWDLPW
jgi:hypothetical protein